MPPCVESAEENAFLASFAGPTAGTCGWTSQADCVWLGLTQSVTTQGASLGWDTWYGNTCHSTYRNWASGQPDDYGSAGTGTGDENCAFIGWQGASTWSDGPCSMPAACFCERFAGPPGPPTPPQPRPPPPPPPPPPPSPIPPSQCGEGWYPAPEFGKC